MSETIKWAHCDEQKALELFENKKVELQYKKNGDNEWHSTNGLQILNVKNKVFRWRYKDATRK